MPASRKAASNAGSSADLSECIGMLQEEIARLTASNEELNNKFDELQAIVLSDKGAKAGGRAKTTETKKKPGSKPTNNWFKDRMAIDDRGIFSMMIGKKKQDKSVWPFDVITVEDIPDELKTKAKDEPTMRKKTGDWYWKNIIKGDKEKIAIIKDRQANWDDEDEGPQSSPTNAKKPASKKSAPKKSAPKKASAAADDCDDDSEPTDSEIDTD